MFTTTKSICIFCAIAAGGWVLNDTAAAQSGGGRRITLQEVQARTNGKLPDLARLTVDVAKYHRRAVQSDYFPKLDGFFANLHANKFMGQRIQVARLGATATLPLLDKDQTIAWATFTQPVTPLFKVRQAVDIAKADERIAQTKANLMNSQVAGNATRIYFELLIAQRRQAATEARVKKIEPGLHITTNVALTVDAFADRRAAFLEASKEAITASGRVTELMHSLNALIGFAPETELELAAPEPQTDIISLQEVTQQAQANSLEVVEAEQTAAKAEAAARLAKLDYVPDVAVVGGYVYQTSIPALPRDFSFIGVMASVNIFDFGKRENTLSERRAGVELARANVDLVKAKVAANAQKAYLDLQRMRKLRDLTRQMAAGYQSELVGYAGLRPEGAAERALAEAEMFQAELDYRDAYSQLRRVIDGQ